MTNQSSKSLAQIGLGSMRRWVCERHRTPCTSPTLNYWGCYVMVWRDLPISKSGICTSWRSNSIRPAITACCCITQWCSIYIYIYIYKTYTSKSTVVGMRIRTMLSNLRSSLLRCGTRPNEWGAQWDHMNTCVNVAPK